VRPRCAAGGVDCGDGTHALPLQAQAQLQGCGDQRVGYRPAAKEKIGSEYRKGK